MWALGDYSAVVTDIVSPLGPILVEAAGVPNGDRVLDVAAGSGNAAIPAALAGAQVVASDLTPELLETGRQIAEQRGRRWNGAKPMPRTFRSATVSSTSCCRAWARCSPRTTRPAPMS
jgi:ubiquinone/menaquinone biosynthesis C-methylase UbiE